MTSITEVFRAAIEAAGLTPPASIIPDGVIHRFASNGDPDDDAGWYVLFADGIPAGSFGCWRASVKQTWCAKAERRMTAAECAAHQRRIAKMQRLRDEDERRQHQHAADMARDIWMRAKPAPLDHAYLRRKGIQPLGLRVSMDGRLIVPVLIDEVMTSLQFIDDDGDKKFLTGGAKRGGSYLIGAVKGVLCIAEGYATAASVHEATGHAVAVALDAGNLLPVAQALRHKHPDVRIIIAGDHDKTGVGQAKAKEAAEAVGGTLLIPKEPGTDWNDVHTRHGPEAVKTAIEEAWSPSYLSPPAVPAHLHTPPPLAQEPNIFARFVETVRVCGVVGEERAAQLIYLALTSRVLAEPVSLAMKGLSSSGKSYVTETTLRFFPTTAYLSMTAMSERALLYMKEDFAHRTLVLFEAVALREQREKTESNLTAYFVRSLLSEGRIAYPVTIRDKHGGFVAKTIVKEGPTNLILTTTATELHGENETRMISLPTNDSADQTRAVLLRLAEGAPPTIDFGEWHRLQDWVGAAEHRVHIPYARYVAEHIPPVAVRLRRDFKAILRLIETHAILHQLSRERDSNGRIVASKTDYLAICKLVADLIAQGVGATVPPSVRETVEAVRSLDLLGTGVTVKAVAEQLRLDRSATQRRLQQAREHGYLVNLEDKRGRPARYTPGDALPEELKLLPEAVFDEGVQVCNDRGGGEERQAEGGESWLEL